ncbi:putative myosin class v heavy chain [Balamuthia mandrillaris]
MQRGGRGRGGERGRGGGGGGGDRGRAAPKKRNETSISLLKGNSNPRQTVKLLQEKQKFYQKSKTVRSYQRLKKKLGQEPQPQITESKSKRESGQSFYDKVFSGELDGKDKEELELFTQQQFRRSRKEKGEEEEEETELKEKEENTEEKEREENSTAAHKYVDDAVEKRKNAKPDRLYKEKQLWEQKQEVKRKEEEARRLRESQKKRKRQERKQKSAQLRKRTKRGQPVMSHLLTHLVAKLEPDQQK